LLDFSHNALVALWFAVEQKFQPDGTARADTDGRVFAAQSNNREIRAAWERSHDVPWADPPDDWSRNIYVWTPPPSMVEWHGNKAALYSGVSHQQPAAGTVVCV